MNPRETGASKLPAGPGITDVSQKAPENRRPPEGQGNSAPTDETNDKTRQSDGTAVYYPTQILSDTNQLQCCGILCWAEKVAENRIPEEQR
jgi:hypothetical protein